MKAGELRHRVTIQQNTPTRDSYGDVIDSWGTVVTVWAAIEPRTGREQFVGGAAQTYAEGTVDIRIRYRTGITQSMRVVRGSEIYNIQAVLNRWGRNKEIILQCTRAE